MLALQPHRHATTLHACRSSRDGSTVVPRPAASPIHAAAVCGAAQSARLPVVEFRSVALAGADRIIGLARIAVRMGVAVRARVQRVFLTLKVLGSGSLHVLNMDDGAECDAPQFEVHGA